MVTPFNLRAAIWAGLVAGLVFLILELLLVPTVGGESPWGPPRMIAAIAMGDDVLPPPATLDLGILLVALAVHFVLTLVYAVIFAWLVSLVRLSVPLIVIAGLVYAMALYAINFYGFTGLFPWFAMARNAISIVAHAVYGLVLGWVYARSATRIATVTTG